MPCHRLLAARCPLPARSACRADVRALTDRQTNRSSWIRACLDPHHSEGGPSRRLRGSPRPSLPRYLSPGSQPTRQLPRMHACSSPIYGELAAELELNEAVGRLSLRLGPGRSVGDSAPWHGSSSRSPRRFYSPVFSICYALHKTPHACAHSWPSDRLCTRQWAMHNSLSPAHA